MECNQGVSLILTVFGNEQGVLMSTCICYFRHLSVSSDLTSPMHLLRSGGLRSKLLVGFCPPCRWEVLFLLSPVVFLSDSGLHAGGKIVLLRKWGRNSAISEFLLQWSQFFLLLPAILVCRFQDMCQHCYFPWLEYLMGEFSFGHQRCCTFALNFVW